MRNTDTLGVRVVYRGKNLKPVYTKEYTLEEYTQMIQQDLLYLITDIENLCYEATGKGKEEWSDRVWVGFNAVKHKMLDKAGDIGRLPNNLYEMEG